MRRPRIALVGAGPAGAYTAGLLLSSGARPTVDLFERLPTPWGLLRAGVAPDHQEIKLLADQFERDVMRPGCRFFGAVEVGRDIQHADLARLYSAVVYANGARTDKQLGIPGEDLPGSMAATDFVAWYNGRPDRAGLDPSLAGERAVVIGNGNVAADVVRLLLRDRDELARTDISDPALALLRASRVREVVVVGRRGPAQAAFTSAELRELGNLTGVDVTVAAEGAALDPASAAWLQQAGTFTARRNVELIEEFSRRPPSGAGRRIVLRFLSSPIRILGSERVEGIELGRNELCADDSGALSACDTGERATLPCDLVLRSVGYRSEPIAGLPFDERRHVLPNDGGRVAPGVYAVGWIKRGPTGILGTNKRDAEQTAAAVIEDLSAGVLLGAPEDADAQLGALLDGRAWVDKDGWGAIDRAERSAGTAAQRPRVKIPTHTGLMAAANGTNGTGPREQTSSHQQGREE